MIVIKPGMLHILHSCRLISVVFSLPWFRLIPLFYLIEHKIFRRTDGIFYFSLFFSNQFCLAWLAKSVLISLLSLHINYFRLFFHFSFIENIVFHIIYSHCGFPSNSSKILPYGQIMKYFFKLIFKKNFLHVLYLHHFLLSHSCSPLL